MRKKKPSGTLNRGPFTAAQLEAAFKLDGWEKESRQTGGSHDNFCHPTRRGKVQIDHNWTAVKTGSSPFEGVRQQGGYSKKELLELLNGRPLS